MGDKKSQKVKTRKLRTDLARQLMTQCVWVGASYQRPLSTSLFFHRVYLMPFASRLWAHSVPGALASKTHSLTSVVVL
eukprot:5654789-Amphidinium_carterae.1